MKVSFWRGMAAMSMFRTESSSPDVKTLHHNMTSHTVESGHTHSPLRYFSGREYPNQLRKDNWEILQHHSLWKVLP